MEIGNQHYDLGPVKFPLTAPQLSYATAFCSYSCVGFGLIRIEFFELLMKNRCNECGKRWEATRSDAMESGAMESELTRSDASASDEKNDPEGTRVTENFIHSTNEQRHWAKAHVKLIFIGGGSECGAWHRKRVEKELLAVYFIVTTTATTATAVTAPVHTAKNNSKSY